MKKIDLNLTKYNKYKFYITTKFEWYSVKKGEIIKMNIKDYKIGVDFLYFHVISKTEDNILSTPKDKPNDFYSFYSSHFKDGDSTLRRITESGAVELELQIMSPVPFFKWLRHKLDMLLNKSYNERNNK